MKKIWKNVSLVLATLLGGTLVFSACNKDGENSASAPTLDGDGVDWTVGTHGGVESDTEYFVVKDGKCDF